MSTSHEYFARRAKVDALARTIIHVFAPELPSADEVTRIWSEDTWATLAAMATKLEGKKVHPPHSRETIDAIAAKLREHADVAELISGPPSSGERRAS